MNRDEAVSIQHEVNMGRHDGTVYWLGQPVTLCNLNYPQHVPQMARIKCLDGSPAQGMIKGRWVKLDDLTAEPLPWEP